MIIFKGILIGIVAFIAFMSAALCDKVWFKTVNSVIMAGMVAFLITATWL